MDAVVLVVSELVTNAVRYGCGPGEVVRLTVDAGAARTRVDVHDARHGTRTCDRRTPSESTGAGW
ncbi:ATP-binding protein [Streptomyces sp. NPDC049906]|uniref:ATP-binding protein n=1 Tax=Streptomyces sp. NPDC049906 TaxID=3155656 RepID=UPI003432046A